MVVAEFDGVAAATACHDGRAYHAALEVFINAAERDFRIIEPRVAEPHVCSWKDEAGIEQAR